MSSNKKFNRHKQRFVFIGPKPPPSHGTSVKFDVFCKYAKERLGSKHIGIIDTQTGDKALVSAYSLSSLRGYFKILLRTFIGGVRGDVIVVFGSQRFATVFGGTVALLFGALGKRVYISLFGGAYDMYLDSFSPQLRKLTTLAFSFSSGIIVETRQQEIYLRDVWPNKTYYVPNFRAKAPLVAPANRPTKNVVRFIYVGVIRREKGIGELLQAFSDLERIVAKGGIVGTVYLDLYGPVYDSPNDYVDLTRALQSELIQFHGELQHEQVLQAYAEADVFIYPSYWPSEGHSGAVIEALMHGLPVIATDWRANKELVHDDVNGLLCPPRDSEALRECMVKLVCNDQLRYRLADGTRLSIHEFDAQYACANMLDTILNSPPQK